MTVLLIACVLIVAAALLLSVVSAGHQKARRAEQERQKVRDAGLPPLE